MSLLEDKKIINETKQNTNSNTGSTYVVNAGNPLAQQDYSTIINAYEKKSSSTQTEEAVLASYYKDVYSTRNFSERVQEQMDYYPGMHQKSSLPDSDPTYTNSKKDATNKMEYWNSQMDNPTAFQNALRDNQQDFDYSEIFGSDASAKTRAENLGKVLTECVPCFGRLLDPGNLLPNLDLLEVHGVNISARLDLLDQVKDLFSGASSFVDICELLNLLSKQCPQDLLAMQMLLTQFLAKLNLEFEFNIDFIVNLVGPILSPFLNSLSQWIDKWMQLILEPMICVIDHINESIIISQQLKIPFSDVNVDGEVNVGDFLSTKTGYNGQEWSDDVNLKLFEADQKKYKNIPPDWPEEEISFSKESMGDEFDPSFSEAEKQKRFDQFEDLKNKRREEQKSKELKFNSNQTINREDYYPPEKQQTVKDANFYLNTDPLIDSVVQLRNILQAGVQYTDDWFTYITQMIYDLLGTEIGWMKKKTGNSFLKSKIIQLLLLVKGIIEAISKNGLRCGKNSNFDIAQMKFIFENTLNKYSATQYEVLDDGSIRVTLPEAIATPETNDNSTTTTTGTGTSETPNATQSDPSISVDIGEEYPSVDVSGGSVKKQLPVKSGIIVKNCLKDLSSDQLNEVRSWIAEYERSTS